MSGTPLFTVVTPENLPTLSRFKLARTGCFLKVASALNWHFSIRLFVRPILRLEGVFGGPTISAKHRGGNDTNPLNDREYRFGRYKPKEKLIFARDRLRVGKGHWLEIGPQWGGHYGFCFAPNHLDIYIPEMEGLSAAITHVFQNPIVPITAPLSAQEIEAVVATMLEELETKIAVRNAVRAGVVADIMHGYG